MWKNSDVCPLRTGPSASMMRSVLFPQLVWWNGGVCQGDWKQCKENTRVSVSLPDIPERLHRVGLPCQRVSCPGKLT